MQRSILILTLYLFCLAACSTALPETATPSISPTFSDLSEQFNLFATQTQVAALTSTVDAQQAAHEGGAPADTPTPLPDIPPVLEEAGPFVQVSPKEAMIVGKVLDMHATDEGILLFSEGGISQFNDDEWTGYFTGEKGTLVGLDVTGRVWVAEADGSQIYRSEPQVWETLDDLESWVTFEGWSPSSGSLSNPVKYGLTSDSRGDLWVITENDVRSFNDAWEVFDSEAMGMPPPTGESPTTFTVYPSPSSGEVYVGRCDWGATGPVGGGGVRAFDGQVWSEMDVSLNSGCVSTMTEDGQGNLWVALDDSLHRYDRLIGAWEQMPLPEAPSQTRFGYFTGLTPGPDDSLWAQLALCNGDGCYAGEILYRLRDGIWQQIGSPSQAVGQKLLFDANDSPWVFFAGNVYQVEDDSLLPVNGLVVLAATTDQLGKLWLVAQSSGPPTLWTLR